MKKLLTLCLALAMTLSVGAYALTTLGSPTAKAADETATETSDTLTVKASEASGFFTTDIGSLTPFSTNPSVAAWSSKLGMTRFAKTSGIKDDVGYFIKFDTPVNVSSYSYLNFKAMYWAEGGIGKYSASDIYNSENTDTGYKADILASWTDGSCEIYTQESLWVSVPVAKIKKDDGTIDGFIIKRSVGSDGWGLMFGDFVLSNECHARVDINNTVSVANGETFNLIRQGGKEINNVKPNFAVTGWRDEELIYRMEMNSKAFTMTVKFTSAIDASTVDYFYFRALGWADSMYAPIKLKNIDGTEVDTLDLYYAWDINGVLDFYIPADKLKNKSGFIEGFVLDGANGVTNLVFSDIVGKKGSPEPVADMLKSNATEGDFKRGEWAAIPPTTTDGLLYNGAKINNGTMNIVFKMPIKASVYKSIDFKALIWNGKDLKDVKISKPDGTVVETIKMKSGTTAEEYGDLNVKINAELLADENGLVSGFSMTMSNNKDGHLVFSAFTGNAEEKVYNAKLVLANGTEENISYTASNRAAKLEEVKSKLGTTGAQYTYSNDVPAELPFEEGKTYTETRTLNKYTVTFKNYNGETLKTETLDYGATPVAPETPAKPYDDDNHYTFKSWDKEIATVTGEVTYTAEFNTVAHVYGEWTTTKAPACTEKGSHKKVCECGKEITEDMPATGHTEVPDAAVAPTCTEPGKTEGSHCSVCGEVLTAQQTVNALGHDMGEFEQTTAPTCTAKGVKTATCKREGCNHTETQDIPAKGHTLEKVEKVAATESKEGVKEHYRCTECGDLFLDENGTTPATEDNLKIAKLQKKGCKGSVGGLGLALAAFGAAFVALKKKR